MQKLYEFLASADENNHKIWSIELNELNKKLEKYMLTPALFLSKIHFTKFEDTRERF